MTFESLEYDLLQFHRRHAEEAFGRRLKRHVVALDLDVGNRLNRDRHAVERVGAANLERDGHHVEREVVDLFEQWDSQGGAALHHPVADDSPVRKLALTA